MSKLVIAIDGPAGAGKTTIAKRVARDLQLRFLDTGAMYRCVALRLSRLGLSAKDESRAADISAGCEIGFGLGDPQPVFMDGEDVTAAIRRPEIGDLASAVSVFSAVRRNLVSRQREIVAEGGVILEGRDTTTVVAPNADVKIYLTAGIETRAQRRYLELAGKGMTVDLDNLRMQIEKRDKRDMTRADSPLTVAPDAVMIDTDAMAIEDVVYKVEELARVKTPTS